MDTPLVLASASPRRQRLVAWLGVPITISAANTPEDLSVPVPPARLAAALAAQKAAWVRADGADGTILAFDTIVVHQGRVLGKPADRTEARQMLEGLSGQVHEVITGVAILAAGADVPDTFAVTTRVSMRQLTASVVDAWVAGDECLGCAGAYNIEHHLASVEDDECYQNVAGMPLCHVYRELASGRVGEVPQGLTAPVAACDAALGRRCRLGPLVCEANV